MKIPASFTKSIEQTFYDKEIKVLKLENITDAEGGVVVNAQEIIDTFKGNVKFSNFKLLQETYGLDYEIDIAISTNYSTLILGDIIEYREIKYRVEDNICCDSHYMVVCKKWEL